MPTVNMADVSQLLKEHFEPVFTEAMDRNIFLFNFFGRKSIDTESLQWKMHIPNRVDTFAAGGTVFKGSSYGEGTPLTGSNLQRDIALEVFVKRNYTAVEVDRFVQAATKGKGAYMEALGRESKENLEDMKDSINLQLMSTAATDNAAQTTGAGNTNLDLDGFRGIMLKGVGAGHFYGGLALDTYTFLKPYVLANGGTPRALNTALMQTITTEMERPARSGAKLSDAICARIHFNQYGNMLSDQRRFVNPTKMDAGYESLAFEGLAITAVPELPAGGLWFVDKKTWGYYTLQNFETNPQSLNTDADRYVITHYSQLICKHPGQNAAIVDLVTT